MIDGSLPTLLISSNEVQSTVGIAAPIEITEKKKCPDCGKVKYVGLGRDFGIKERVGNKVRWDKECLACKAKRQAERRATKPAHKPRKEVRDDTLEFECVVDRVNFNLSIDGLLGLIFDQIINEEK